MGKNKRREFLKNACAPVLIGVLGIPLIQACSKDDNSAIADTSSSNVKTSITIDLNESEFSNLREVGGWFNYTAKNLLLVRVSESIIRAFDNSCPHQGSRNSWSYSNNTFRCSTHGNEFSDSCNSALRCYNSSLSGNILTVSN